MKKEEDKKKEEDRKKETGIKNQKLLKYYLPILQTRSNPMGKIVFQFTMCDFHDFGLTFLSIILRAFWRVEKVK